MCAVPDAQVGVRESGTVLPAPAVGRFSSSPPTWCTGARPSSSTRCVRTMSTCFLPTPVCVCEYLWLPEPRMVLPAQPGPHLGMLAGLCCVHVLIVACPRPVRFRHSKPPCRFCAPSHLLASGWWMGSLVGVGSLDLDSGTPRGFGLCPWLLLPLEGKHLGLSSWLPPWAPAMLCLPAAHRGSRRGHGCPEARRGLLSSWARRLTSPQVLPAGRTVLPPVSSS